MTRTSSCLLVGTVFALSVCSGQTAARNAAARKGIFVPIEKMDAWAILPNPAADRSPAAEAELAEVHRIQETRSVAEIAHAKADDVEEDIFIFRDVIGDKFVADALPQTALLSAHLHNDESVIGGAAKAKFKRMRPFNVDKTVKPVCKVNNNIYDYGYPSGHSLTGYLEALTLIQIIPERRDAILARADDYAHSRVVCGVHYSSDGAASKLAAYAMMGVMLNNPQYQKELEAARAETRRALGLQP